MREQVGVEDGVGAEHLDEGVIPDACHHYADVEQGQGHEQRVEVGAHLRLPGKRRHQLYLAGMFHVSDNVVINSPLFPVNIPMIAT